MLEIREKLTNEVNLNKILELVLPVQKLWREQIGWMEFGVGLCHIISGSTAVALVNQLALGSIKLQLHHDLIKDIGR